MNLKELLTKKIKIKIEPSLMEDGNDAALSTGKHSSTARATTVENPYIKDALGRQEWDDRYLNMFNVIKQGKFLLCAMLGLIAIFAFIIVREANKVKVQPFIVEVNEGIPIAIKSMSEGDPNDKRIILFALEQFIINARTVLSDDTAEKATLAKVYAYSSDNAVVFLDDYYKENDPFVAASTHTTSVDIVNTLKVGDNTYQITWDETLRDRSTGTVMDKLRYIGDVTYKMGEVDKRFMKDNPFGLYVSQLSWSQNKV
jgi:type IV secretion system protein TrbF